MSLATLEKGLSYQDLLRIARTGHIDVMMSSLMRCFEASARNHTLSGTFTTTTLKSESQSLSTKMQVATEYIEEQETEGREDEVVTSEQVKAYVEILEEMLLEAPTWVVPKDPVEAKRFKDKKVDTLVDITVSEAKFQAHVQCLFRCEGLGR